jgi:hypothetical protein
VQRPDHQVLCSQVSSFHLARERSAFVYRLETTTSHFVGSDVVYLARLDNMEQPGRWKVVITTNDQSKTDLS